MLASLLGSLPVPTEYPSQDHFRFHQLTTAFAASAQTSEEYITEFRAALSGLVYRYCACRESCRAFVESVTRDGDSAPQPVRYYQDREFFGFVVNGLAAIETLSYAAYAAGATFWPHLFPFGSEAARRAVGPRSTARAYDLAGQAEFAAMLQGIVDSAECRAWDRYRTAVRHRSMPGPTITAAAVDEMLRWLGETLGVLMAALVSVAEAQPLRTD